MGMESKKVLQHPRLYQKLIFGLTKMKPERRQLNFVFKQQGNCIKSLTADHITLNPCFNPLCVYLIELFYKKKPKTIKKKL